MGYSWGKIYKREIINSNKLTFNEALSSSEDFLFFFSYVMLCDKIFFSHIPIVEYRIQNGESLSTNSTLKRVLCNLYVYDFVFNKVYELNPSCDAVLNYISATYISNVLDSRFTLKKEYKIIKKKIKQNNITYNYYKSKKMGLKRLLIKLFGIKKNISLINFYNKYKS